MSEHGWIAYDELGWVDIFARSRASPTLRPVVKQRPVGLKCWWRLDYMLVTPGLSGSGLRQAIYRDERFSDHAPLTIDFDIPAPE